MDLYASCSTGEGTSYKGDMTISRPRNLFSYEEPLGFNAKTPPTRPKTLNFKTDVMQSPKEQWKDSNKCGSPDDSSQSDKLTFLLEESDSGTPSSQYSHDHTLGELDSKMKQFCLTHDPDINEVKSPTFVEDAQDLSHYMKKTLDDVKDSVNMLDKGCEKGKLMNQKIRFSISKIERTLDVANSGISDTRQLMNDVTEGNIDLQNRLEKLRCSVASKECVMDDLRATLSTKSKDMKKVQRKTEIRKISDVNKTEKKSVSWQKR